MLSHARHENACHKVKALVLSVTPWRKSGSTLMPARGIEPDMFLFQESQGRVVTQTFHELARLTKGAHCNFNPK